MQNSIEELIKEQKKTQEIYERLEKTGTFEKFFSSIPPATFSYMDNPFRFVDNWDYEALEKIKAQVIGQCFLDSWKTLSRAKTAYGYVDDLYNNRVSDWIGYKNHLEKNKPANSTARWQNYYSNPDCLKFFENYEKAHDITKSIYKESQK